MGLKLWKKKTLEDPPKWSPLIRHKDKLTLEDAKFIFEQAEKTLKGTIEAADIVVQRTNAILTIVVGLIIGITAYIIKKWTESPNFDDLLVTAIIGDSYLFLVGLLAVRNINPRLYDSLGSVPKDMFVDIFFIDQIPNEKRMIKYYVSEIENYQFRIERNSKTNIRRWTIYKQALYAFLLTPIIFLLAFIITLLVPSCEAEYYLDRSFEIRFLLSLYL